MSRVERIGCQICGASTAQSCNELGCFAYVAAPTVVRIGDATLYLGDSREVLRTLPEASVDSIVCDPPYELGFMGKGWDSTGVANDPVLWREVLRVLKPGGHLLAFSGTRTYHRMVCAIEDAGFEIRDQIGWLYGSGFPKSHNGEWGGTALKPAWEPIAMARKPLVGTVEANWMAYGTGALNIDACRVPTQGEQPRGSGDRDSWRVTEGRDDRQEHGSNATPDSGRWPANIIHDGSDEVLAGFPETTSGAMKAGTVRAAQDEPGSVCYGTFGGNATDADTPADSGSAARFFYCAKADKEDRNEGCGALPKKQGGMVSNTSGQHITRRDGGAPGPRANHHPTVKPTDLMRYLCRLVTPKGGTVLDPFMGSGSTGKAALLEGFAFIGIDLTPEYVEIARARIEFAKRQGFQPDLLEAA